MLPLEPRLLAADCRPLLYKFYRLHNSRMRVPAGAECWALGTPITAGLCLTPTEHGWWLTGLLVDPAQRHQGLARRLVTAALASRSGPTWLFCHPTLTNFYGQLGFGQVTSLPPTLSMKFERYSQHKPLVALSIEGNHRCL